MASITRCAKCGIFATVTNILTQCQGADLASVAGHSYRRGGATAAYRAGAPEARVQLHRDWATLSCRIYQELTVECRAKCSRMVFEMLLTQTTCPRVPAVSPPGPLGHCEELVTQA